MDSYQEASLKTADNLLTIAQSGMVQNVSHLSLPEIEGLVDAVARVAPAGNVPGVIVNGLARLSGRRPPPNVVKRDVNLLFKGVESALDKAVYGAFFAGPAAVIWGYQNLLQLAGKDPTDSFPDGLWQFYVEYALREDTARHANETHGFDTVLNKHNLNLSKVDRLTAWVMASASILHQYPALLANEWRERVYTSLLAELTAQQPDAAHYAGLYRQWIKKRPYGRGHDADPQHNYATYRRIKFDQFLAENTRNLSMETYQQWVEQIQARKPERDEYKQQMSILAYLQPDAYGETRHPIPVSAAKIGLIYQGRYYLIPICGQDGRSLITVDEVRRSIAGLLSLPTGATSVKLTQLASMKRSALAEFRKRLNPTLTQSLEALRFAPVFINADQRARHLSLATIRQAERGIGDHALTIFDTGETFVFDQSHIFFDGALGSALAEMMTLEATSWAVYLHQQAEPAAPTTIMKPLQLPIESKEKHFIERAERVTHEVGVENTHISLKHILATRRLFKQRSDLIQLTVNDLFILYRAVHALTYKPSPRLLSELEQLGEKRHTETAVSLAVKTLTEPPKSNPAIFIPIDGSQETPRERLYPLVFEIPLQELDLIALHERTTQALDAYKQGSGQMREDAYIEFDQLQRTYLAALAGFGQVLSQAKEIGIRGQSASSGSIRMLANMPAPIQRLLDAVPNRFDVLNDLIKGREVFSNVGAVAPSSTLTRFITAKDDNDKKDLAWGVLTDANDVVTLTLRDFRPYVGALIEAGYRPLAQKIAQHYLDSYAIGFNQYLQKIRHITLTSRETQLLRPDEDLA